jgi:outer membrane protein OmpA-like peptidoglycan-associated protein
MKSYVILFLILMITGCSLVSKEPPLLQQEVQNTLKQARDNLNAVERVQAQELYPYDYQEAHNGLIEAENALEENRHDQAYLAALRSVAASQRIFRQLYRDVITPSARETQAKMGTAPNDNPNSALLEFLGDLNDILDYSDKIESGQRTIEPAKIVKDYNTIKQLGQNAQTSTEKILTREISFESGKYDLSDEEKNILKEFYGNLIANKHTYTSLYPNKPVSIHLKVVGYADQMDFRGGTNLIGELVKDASHPLPGSQAARRQFLNQRLSELRARTTAEYLKQAITQTDLENPQAQIEAEILGLGEDIPPGVSSPYPLSDHRRRICKIHAYVTGR